MARMTMMTGEGSAAGGMALAFSLFAITAQVMSVDAMEAVDWTVATPLPSKRSDMTATVSKATGTTKIYVVGGCAADQIKSDSGDFYCPTISQECAAYVPETDTYESCADAPLPRYRHAAVNVNGSVWLVGGRDGMDAIVKEIHAYDPVLDTWTTIATLDDVTSDLGAFVTGDSLHLVGGYTQDYEASKGNVKVALEAASNGNIVTTAAADLIEGRGDVFATVQDGFVYVTGGFSHLDWCNPLTTVERYDIAQDKWTNVAEIGIGRGDKALVTLDQWVFAIGGEHNAQCTETAVPVNDVEVYHSSVNTWTVFADIPEERFRFVAAAVSELETIYIFGGQKYYDVGCDCFAVSDDVLSMKVNEDVMGDSPVEGAPPCRKFDEIYPSGKELCERMWDDAFEYSTKEDEAYTMWFFNANKNPNDDVTQKLVNKGLFQTAIPVDKCYLEYFHKNGEDHPLDNDEHPTNEPEDFQECHPWAERSCCHQDTVSSAEKIKKAYGPEWHWDRCGPLSPACERFFVMEACFYECEPNAGLYRKHKGDSAHPDPFQGQQVLHTEGSDGTNSWQMHKMPIKASFCDAWWLACKEDLFCADSGGSYFSCAKAWGGVDQAQEEQVPPGSCKDSCGKKSANGACRCDEDCEKTNECCADREEYCKPEWVPRPPFGSCEDSCGKQSQTGTCFCDPACSYKGDCCDDRGEQCPTPAPTPQPTRDLRGSCEGACGKKTETPGGNCWCDSKCVSNTDCCSDLEEVCVDGATTKPGDCSSGANC